jgi:glucokinase
VLIGDVGGTNVRLQLVKVKKNQQDYSKARIVKFTTYKTHEFQAFVEFIELFIKDLEVADFPALAIVGRSILSNL